MYTHNNDYSMYHYPYRWNGASIITVREAAWLTENTYKYEEVVRTVGEMLAVFNGQIRVRIVIYYSLLCTTHIFTPQVPCTTDYIEILLTSSRGDTKLRHMTQYISEMTLLYTELRMSVSIVDIIQVFTLCCVYYTVLHPAC